MRQLCLFFALIFATACSDSNGLADPTSANAERTETLYALVGTPVGTPSAYAIEGARRIRTDISVDFDFAYNVQTDGTHVLLPRNALGIDAATTVNPGLMARTESFEAIKAAVSNGYTTDRAVPITVGERYLVRSRVTCNIGVPKYAKIEVLAFDDVARTITFRILTDDNCGFRDLEPGLPKN
jgi:hypothetical protein